MIAAFMAGTIGSLSLAFLHVFGSLALVLAMGANMATVAINPLLRVAGGEEHFAFNSAFAQSILGTASFASPRVYSFLAENLGKPSSRNNLRLRTLAKHAARTSWGGNWTEGREKGED